MENLVVHRIVEQHAAARGNLTALDHDGASLTYRELNVRANGVARQLVDAGFRRGGHLMIATAHGLDLATVLLAVLKTGGAYTWHLPGELPWHAAIAPSPEDSVQNYRAIDLRSMLRAPLRPSPNLPVLTRPSDVACVLTTAEQGQLLVPHSTIAALHRQTGAATQVWEGEPSTFDLWTGLMNGSTLSVTTAPALLNAA